VVEAIEKRKRGEEALMGSVVKSDVAEIKKE
jgi:hypothetical protein